MHAANLRWMLSDTQDRFKQLYRYAFARTDLIESSKTEEQSRSTGTYRVAFLNLSSMKETVQMPVYIDIHMFTYIRLYDNK